MTGLRDYRAPIEQRLRYACGLRQVVSRGAPFAFDVRGFEAARERAGQLNAQFIDARSRRWLISSRGGVVVVVEGVAADVM